MSAIPDRADRSDTPLPLEALPTAPSGTVTFVFTDIEGSTQRWDRDRAAMQDAVRRHDAILRAAIANGGGHVFKTIGDAFCAAFSRPEDAVAATLNAQRALAAQDFSGVDGIRVRAAIHVGTADERDNDYFGPTVNRVARLLSIGHGGQVLLSGVTADLVQGVLPPQATLRDLDEHRLKDLSRPEHVYQLYAPGLTAEFPPLRSLDKFANNLPLQLTSLIGREPEIAEITALVDAQRLVTLVGSGGVGKTRASLQVGANLLDGSGDGVWFVELAPLASGEHIPTTVAAAMGLTLGGEGDPLANLISALKPKTALLILDNCEHLIDAAAPIIAGLLRGCARIKILATSRQGLDLPGEIRYRMPSLSLPSENDAAHLVARDVPLYAALDLFVERARSADGRFVLTDENAPVVADICRRLDGIALAIELAAARVKILSPRQLRNRLDERFRLLTGGRRDLLPRQQTLRALIDWSHDLLDERERRLFRRVGIFVNGFTLEGAVAVGSDDHLDEFEVIDILASLVEQSLVLAESTGDTLRYRLLESTRAYALEKLSAACERDLVASLHLRYLRDRMAGHFAEAERTVRTAEWIEAFQIELEDIRAGLDAALTRPDSIAGAELLAAIERVWTYVALENEGIARIGSFVGMLASNEPLLQSKLLAIQAMLFIESGRHQRGHAAAEESVAYARASTDRPALASALVWFSAACTFCGDFRAAENALSEADALPVISPRLHRARLQARAALCVETGDFAAAAPMYMQLRDAARSCGDTRGEHISALAIAETEHALGRSPAAIALVREILPALRRGADTALVTYVLAIFAGFLVATDDLDGAIDAAHETIALCAARDMESPELARAIGYLALVSALRDDVSRAAVLQGYAEGALARGGSTPAVTEKNAYARLNAILSAHFAPADLARLTAQGAALSAEAAVALALEVTPR